MNTVSRIPAKEMNKAERVAAAKAIGEGQRRIGLYVKITCAVLLGIAIVGVYSVVQMMKDGGAQVIKTVE